ncbi:hypothetical protein [Leptolyngbya sp. FACHB-541]|uniref:hypothetical protein n=1 Tax=Leptolyngbya sp. FACHB-541 TaxID=2692810 RepID=UPI001F55678A|nr:hypothetical protein [Leptolyngbya sp. FACHB-541]
MVTCRVIPYEGDQLALPIKPGKVKPVVSHCLVIGDRLDPYQAPVIERLPVGYATPQSVRLVRGVSVDMYPKRVTYNKPEFNADHSFVYCLPEEQSWATAVRLHGEFQAALEAIAKHLRSLGAYSTRLKEAGGLKKAPNPLTPTVILAEDPDSPSWGVPNYLGWWGVSRVERYPIVKHSAVMMRLQQGTYEQPTSQQGKFCCPDDAAWQRLQQLQEQAIAISETIRIELEKLGTYQQARLGKVLWLSQRKPQPESDLQFVPVSVEELAVGDRITPAHRPGSRYGRVTGFRKDRKTPVLVTFDGDVAEGNWGATALLKVVDKHTCIQANGSSTTQATTRRDNTSGRKHSQIGSEQPRTDDEGDRRETPNLAGDGEKVPLPAASSAAGDDQQSDSLYVAPIPPELKAGDSIEAEIIGFDAEGLSCWITVQGVVRERNRYDREGIPIEHIHFDREISNGVKAWDCVHPDRIKLIHEPAPRCSLARYLSLREPFEEETIPPEPDPYIQPIKPFQDESLTVTLEPGDWVQVVADDDLYEKVVIVSRILPTFEVEIVYDGLHFAYPRSSLRLHARATTESLFALKVENDKFRKSLEEGYSKVKNSDPKLENQRRDLLAELDKVRREGAIAPTGCWMENYTTYKKLASGEKKPFIYKRIRAEKAIFEKDGKPVKRLHLGTEADPQYQEWQERLERRRKVNALERKIDKIERQLQAKRQP